MTNSTTVEKATAAIDAGNVQSNPAAMKALLDTFAERADRKIAQKKRNARAAADVGKVLGVALGKGLPLNASVKAALSIGFRMTEDSLSWFIQSITQDLFWAYRSMASRRDRADQQAQAMAEDTEFSVAEVLAAIADDFGGLDKLADEDRNELSYTTDDLEAALVELHSVLSDFYVMTADSGLDKAPLLTRGHQVATSVAQAMVLSEMVIEDGNRQRRASDLDVLR